MIKRSQAAYDEVRNLLLDGIHLSPPDYRLPFHGCGDASNDGKSFGQNQYNDLPPGTDFTVRSHSPTGLSFTSPKPTKSTPSYTTTPAVSILPGGLNAGLTPTANAPRSISRPTLFYGA
jgi:hypothetical protein